MRCFIDLDGVLVDFVGGACKLHGKVNPYSNPANVGTWDFIPLLGHSKASFYAPMGKEFWYSLEPMPDATEIVQACTDMVGVENICLLTSPVATPGCIEGKTAWVKRHFPAFSKQILFGSAKYFCASPSTLLIDDYDVNVLHFTEHGGNAILYPRPWNTRNAEADRSLKALAWDLACACP